MENSLEQNELIISKNHRPLGEILIEAGLISATQLEIALQQQQNDSRRIGEILASHKWIKQKTADFFVEKWAQLLRQKQKKPLVYYFRHSGLLDEQQIAMALREQKQQEKPTRFHRLVVERGYIKQLTVDFFLANIFEIYHSNVFSFAKPYEILTRYNKGETDFRRTELSKAPLMGVSLKGIKLDGSNLREANLSSCNLSNSSLKQTNLALVNFIKAILTEVNFERANLCQANLGEAHLKDANFTQANLQKADLDRAYLFNTNFAKADLRYAKLPVEYTYKVFYDSETMFDESFDPKQAGWIKIDY
ncbi:pentapeptide repeat-containing protein [Waterburya agarophytonicola K14]|uniref:Pentapeptide repeat-containing protein n=1 Tax=Waterburya agarophytonicola KI4 TaxID=2874699 RepID=A0A964FI51_9CYAN|nr:pentapeptide repeat-containing protein [Waterburya agarophytonicola]MCC0179651.1 pentapeptide repeat-containing protein [Waterburya agarophytonicola KI4]